MSSSLYKKILYNKLLDSVFGPCFAFRLYYNKFRIFKENPIKGLCLNNSKNSFYVSCSKMWFEMTSVSNLIFNNYSYQCFCNKKTGCKVEYRARNYCTLCIIKKFYELDKVEEVKYKPSELMSYAIELYNDLKVVFNFDETIAELWGRE